MLQDYTTYDQIRAAVALSVQELPDATLAQPIFEHALYEALAEFGDTFTVRYAEVLDLASPTSSQQRFLRLTQLVATYAVAKALATGAIPRAPQTITDGRASITRFEFSEVVIEGLNSTYSTVAAKLVSIFNLLYPAEAIAAPAVFEPFILSGATGLAADPVVQ